MQIILNRFILICIVLDLLSLDAAGGSQGRTIAGTWQGVLKVNTISLRIVFHVSERFSGGMDATMDSPDQGAKGIRVDSISLTGDAVLMIIQRLHGEYAGRLMAGDSVIDGSLIQNGMRMDLVLKKNERIIELKRPQEPLAPFPYITEDVMFGNDPAGIQIAGTLTLPGTGKPAPAVLLISGSGMQNRNEEIMGHKPFLVLADYLTRRGIAVLRVDDRGVGQSTGNFASATSEDFASDVRAGLKYLRSRREIDAKKIGLLGHSEGGIIAPMVAVKDKDVAWIILMAGTGVPGGRIIVLQDSVILRKSGVPDSTLRRNLALQKSMVDIAESEDDTVVAVGKLLRLYDEALAGLSDAERSEAMKSESQVKAQLRGLCSPWMRYFLRHDPRPVLKRVRCPVLAVIGEKDVQVTAADNLPEIRRALQDGGNRDAVVKELPGLNHLFQTATTGLPSEYSSIEETLSPLFLQTVGDWMLEKAGIK